MPVISQGGRTHYYIRTYKNKTDAYTHGFKLKKEHKVHFLVKYLPERYGGTWELWATKPIY